MTPRQTILMVALGLLGLTAFVETSSYAGRQALVRSERAGCYRAVAQRVATVNGAWLEQTADNVEAVSETGDAMTAQLRAAAKEGQLARVDASLVTRARARELPTPLRMYATFSCTAAYPAASVWP